MTMTTEELRLECLRLAAGVTHGLVSGVTTKLAREYFDFVSNSPVPNETPAGFNVDSFLAEVVKTTTQANAEDAEVEAVARAILSTPDSPECFGSIDEDWPIWAAEARAAIEALDRVRRTAARVDDPVA